MKGLLLGVVFTFCCSFLTVTLCARERIESFPADMKEKYVFTVYQVASKRAITQLPHYLKEPCAAKWSEFQANYTRVYEQNVGFSSTTVEFAKPGIYHAVMRINKYIIKSVKKKKLSKEEASTILCHVLDCANTIFYEEDTLGLEKELSALKDVKAQIELFKQIRLIRNN